MDRNNASAAGWAEPRSAIDVSESDVWREHKASSQQRRARNREAGAAILKKSGIAFVEKNHGAHLIVADGAWDFWPGTGLWRERLPRPARGRHGRGVRNLIDIIRQDERR